MQNGFMGAYFSSLAGLDEPQTIRVYDVNTEGGASAAYRTPLLTVPSSLSDRC